MLRPAVLSLAMQRSAAWLVAAQGCLGCATVGSWPQGVSSAGHQQFSSSGASWSTAGRQASSAQQPPRLALPPPTPPPSNSRLYASAAAAAAAVALGTAAYLSQQPAQEQHASSSGGTGTQDPGTPGWLQRQWGGATAERHHDPPRSTPQAQAAVATCLASPLLLLLKGTAPPPGELSRHSTPAAAQAAVLEPWELSSVLWGWAALGSEPAGQLLAPLTSQAVSALHHLPLYDAIASAWALYLLQDLQPLPQGLWRSLLARVAKAEAHELDEACTLYLLQCAMQQAALEAANLGPGQGLPPRATAQEVEALLEPLPKNLRSKVIEAHHSYVPFHPYVEGAYMTVLHLLKVLPALADAAAAAPDSVYGRVFGGLGPADMARARALAADVRQLSRVKRELAWHWRQDELLDRRQRVLNQVVYLLTRRLAQHIQTPADVDVLLPNRRLAIFIEDSMDTQSATPTQQSSDLDACGEVLRLLLRENFAPGKGTGFARRELPGPCAAKRRCLLRRGWRCVVLQVPSDMDVGKLEVQLRRLLQDT